MKIEGKRVLAVGAHPDDVEILCSGLLLLLKELGCRITVATMSLGDCGSTERPGPEMRRVRRREAERSCVILGADYHYVGFSDFGIFHDDAGNRRTAALLRDVNPWLVVTHPPEDYISDHEITSTLVRNATFVAPAPNYDTSSFSPSQSSSAIPYLYYAQPVENKDIFGRRVYPSFYVDVSDKLDLKEELLACHKSQRDWLRSHHGMDEYLDCMRRWNAALGASASENSGRSIAFAEGYRQHLGHSYPQDNILEPLLEDRIVSETKRGSSLSASHA